MKEAARLKTIEINPKTNRLEIDITNCPGSYVVIISEGKAKVRKLPNYGEYKIITHQGKVKRMRKEEGEEY
ncbi:XtrA/YqaO family protein [Cytobacillus sp. FSL W8-0315]|uniref:XtrA/YqaO family protein n=1 Tax=Cytobacillus sp. FSL W8-0315 TaxID=2921600 RepID=UPI0030FBD434